VQVGDLQGHLRVGDTVRVDEGHGVDPELAGDDELDPGQVDPGDGQLPPLQGPVRERRVNHQRSPGRRQVRQADGFTLEVEDALIHLAGCAVSAADGDIHVLLQQFCGVAAADDGRLFQLPADNGRVAGGTTAVG